MPTYVTLASFTEKGLNGIKDTVKRAEPFKAAAASQGAHVREFLWTQGAYDMVCVIEAPDDTAMSALMLNASKMATSPARRCGRSRRLRWRRFWRGSTKVVRKVPRATVGGIATKKGSAGSDPIQRHCA
jgi:uncharacterized protein with GYD domain